METNAAIARQVRVWLLTLHTKWR